MTSEFEILLLKRFNFKSIETGRVDTNGKDIQFLLTQEQFFSIFEPYEFDERMYLSPGHKDYLCLCRKQDLGDYEIENVYVDTRSNNVSTWIRNNPEKFLAISKLGKARSDELYPEGAFKGRKHKIGFFEKQSKTFKDIKHSQGQNNSQFGTCWIYDDQLGVNKKIPKIDLDLWLNNGWTKGRKMFFQ